LACSFEDIADFHISKIWLEMPIHAQEKRENGKNENFGCGVHTLSTLSTGLHRVI